MTDAPHHRTPVKDPIARRLREARDTPMERSQTEWSKLLGVTKALVSHWETGRARPSYETMTRVFELSTLSCDYLIAGRPSPTLKRFIALPPALREWLMLQVAVAERAHAEAPWAYDSRITPERWQAFEAHLRQLESGMDRAAVAKALEDDAVTVRWTAGGLPKPRGRKK